VLEAYLALSLPVCPSLNNIILHGEHPEKWEKVADPQIDRPWFKG